MKASQSLQDLFYKRYNAMIAKGKTEEFAMEKAMATCYNLYWKDTEVTFADERLAKIYADYRRVWDGEFISEYAESYLTNAAVKYHEARKPFDVRRKNGKTERIVAVKVLRPNCKGCMFAYSRFENVADRFENVTHCRLNDYGKHAVCRSMIPTPLHTDVKVREDDVIFVKC